MLKLPSPVAVTPDCKIAKKTIMSTNTSHLGALSLSKELKYAIFAIVGVAFLAWIVRFVRYRQSYKSLVSI